MVDLTTVDEDGHIRIAPYSGPVVPLYVNPANQMPTEEYMLYYESDGRQAGLDWDRIQQEHYARCTPEERELGAANAAAMQANFRSSRAGAWRSAGAAQGGQKR